MKGKICLVTGATSGIGKVTAQTLAGLGAHVVITARDPARGRRALEEVQKEGSAELLLADFSSLAQVRSLAREFLGRHSRLDVLVNNAGAINMTRQVTAEGFELTFAANHLAPFVLTGLLLPALKASAPSRVVTISSIGHLGGHLDFQDPQGERNYGGLRAYNQSKLANVLFTFELARRLEGSGVTANCLHPGAVATGFAQNRAGAFGVLVGLAKPFLLSATRGARTTLYLACSPEVEKVSGKYFARCKPARASREARNPEIARRLWELSERLTGSA